jgi:hypothetical protein
MIQILREQPIEWPDYGPLTLEAPPVTVTVSVSPTTARRRATSYLVSEIAMTLLAHNPRLVVGEQVTWRFDIDLCLPHTGCIATLGTIDVNADSAVVIPLTANKIAELIKNANALAARHAS